VDERVIKGMHGLFYVPNPEEVRAFIRDKLGFAHNDIGEGWLIFDMPEADLGVHPSDSAYHSISFYCADIHKTVEELGLRGVEFSSGITDEGWGLLTHFRMPGGVEVELYQQRYEKRSSQKMSRTKATTRARRESRKRV
jgi:hypothetical protein